MKKHYLFIQVVVFLVTVIPFSLIAPNAKADQCATFDFSRNTLHIPCLNLGATSLWVDLELNQNGFQLNKFGDNGSAGSRLYCASLDPETSNMHVPCFKLENSMFMLDMVLISLDPAILFDLKGYGSTRI